MFPPRPAQTIREMAVRGATVVLVDAEAEAARVVSAGQAATAANPVNLANPVNPANRASNRRRNRRFSVI
jgi:hypothetical protein